MSSASIMSVPGSLLQATTSASNCERQMKKVTMDAINFNSCATIPNKISAPFSEGMITV